MNPEQALARLKTLAGALTRTQLLVLSATFVAVVGGVIASSYWLNASGYVLLYSDMDPEAAAEVVTRLKTQKVPYRLDEGGRAVRVPAGRVDELRLDFSAQGLPTSGRIGFEIFDRTAFGATEFLEHVNYRRALEGEIARTIGTIREVASARVHIAMAKDSIFEARAQPAKASVVLKLRASRGLPAATVQGITSLVAASVEGLRPEAVVVLDSFGRPLARPPDPEEAAVDGLQLERQQRVERELAGRVVSLLEPIVGPSRVRVNVSARLEAATREETEERFDPESVVVRSRETTADGAAGAVPTTVSGSRANIPPPADGTTPPDATGAAAPAPRPPTNPGRAAETTNYEISRVTRHTVRPRGEIARLSVAVIVDDDRAASKDAENNVTWTSTPRTPAEIQKIQALVSAAVGFDPQRGDQITVENISFDEPVVEEAVPPGFLERFGPSLMDVARILAVLILGALVILFVVRPIVTGTIARPAAAGAGGGVDLPRPLKDLEGEIEAQLAAAAAGDRRRLPVLTKRVTELAYHEPQSAARLLRSWMQEDHK